MTELIDTVRRRLRPPQQIDQKKPRMDVIKRCLHHIKNCDDGELSELSACEVKFCNIIAWTGVMVITVIIFRSLYLLYLKPEGT